jgi:pilus assembly protein Flp/PilA
MGEVEMKRLFIRLFREEEGATALEYALLVVLVAITMSLGAVFFGESLAELFDTTATEVETVNPASIPDANPTLTH